MGRKVHPYIFRIGSVTNWKSRWFSDRKKYKELLAQDYYLREFVAKKLDKAGVKVVEVERSAGAITVVVKTARPGLIIGRGGSGVEDLKKSIKAMFAKHKFSLTGVQLKIDIIEIRQPNMQSAIVAQDMAAQIEKRMPYRRVIKQTLDKIMQNREVQGAKIAVKGRLNGADIARKEWLKKGRIPLQNLRANIDYAGATAFTTYGTIGLKVWIYKGEVFEDDVKPKDR